MDEKAVNEIFDADTVANENGLEIAVIGLAGRFPGAADINRFWENLQNGVESIATLSDEELQASGFDPDLLRSPNYVKAAGLLEGTEMFDASFFRCSPREAKTMAPQHRILLECAYEALQHAGCDAQRYPGAIGVFAGESSNAYAYQGLIENSGSASQIDGMQADIGNDREFLSTVVSYKLNLRGPSLTIQTACSTSLVAAHMAYQSLLSGECDIALAGGITIRIPQKAGYIYEKEGILSPDGHCRAFDASAQGTVGGEGVGIVVLKRLEDARADGDCIHAVIKGSAMNNDGSHKVGFTAPSVEGEAEVVARAQAMAEVEPESIGYIEAHGTGTQLGDPIEISALTRAFRARGSEANQYCAIGSVKTNIGHLDTAAGIAGLIKTILMLKHRQIPPSLHYREANPQIDFVHSPFYVNHILNDWQAGPTPLRAGVSSFGIGGSNVHMVLEEPPRPRPVDEGLRKAKLLLLSARTDAALDRSCEDLVAHLKAGPDLSLADVAFTLQSGRQQFNQRRMLVCEDCDDAINALEQQDPKRVLCGVSADDKRPVVFMFPGQGAQYINMGRELYEVEPEFRRHFDDCCELLKPDINVDLRDLLFVDNNDDEVADKQINQTSLTQPALFALEYSLARLWMSWGVYPQAMIGHSIGEYVAACLAGVFSLADALSLVSARAAMMQSVAAGSMLAVPMSPDEIHRILGSDISVAAINEPSMCVISGTTERIKEWEAELARQGAECRQLRTSHAFHSEMMDVILQPFADLLCGVKIGKPKIPYVSNLTGTWITAEDIAAPAYWVDHLRHTVQFADGLDKLFEDPRRVFLEVGPGQALSGLARNNPRRGPDHQIISSMRPPKYQLSEINVLMNSLGRLWLAGVDVNWLAFHGDESRQRVPLPSYPFERKSFWLEQQRSAVNRGSGLANMKKHADLGRWFYAPGWKSAIAPLLNPDSKPGEGSWLIFSDNNDLEEQLLVRLREMGQALTVVNPAEDFGCVDSNRYMVRPGKREDMATLFAELRRQEQMPDTILHLWSLHTAEPVSVASNAPALEMSRNFYSILHLAQVLAEGMPSAPVELVIVTSGAQSVAGDKVLYPDRAAVSGLCRVIPQEQDRLRCRTIDIEVSNEVSLQQKIARQLLTEVSNGASEHTVALRQSGRWVQIFEPVYLGESRPPGEQLRPNGVYLITGGFGNIGLSLARYLAQVEGTRLVLTSRSRLPQRDAWDEELLAQGADSAVGRKIAAVRALEAAGATVLAVGADVADEAQMRAVVAEVVDKYGQIDGVIHAAAATDRESIQPLRDLHRDAFEPQFIPKIRGLAVLDKVLEGQKPDFCIIMSSLASMLGGLGFAAYASANAFMDAYAHSRFGFGTLPWLSVNWDGWQFGETEASSDSTIARLAMTPQEGVEAFARLLPIKAVPQLVVSTGDMQARLEQWAKPLEIMDADNPLSDAASHAPERRSELVQTDFTQAGIERRLCSIWADLIGVDQVDANDNFFDLGGDSLMALQVTSRLRESLIADLSAATVMEAPTVAELTQRVLQQRQHSMSADSDQASALLQQIQNFSADERKSLLAEARKSQGIAK